MFHNRTSGDKPLGTNNTPAPTKRVNPLEGHDVAIHIDGVRITNTALVIDVVANGDNPIVAFYAESTLEACLNPEINAVESMAWNGFKPGDTISVREKESDPMGGIAQIETIIMPVRESDGSPKFTIRALTPLYNLDTGDLRANVDDVIEIPVTWAFAMKPVGSPVNAER